MSARAIIAWGGAILVVGAVTAGLFAVDTPGAERAARRDHARAQDLHAIAYEVRRQSAKEGAPLPQSLADVEIGAQRELRLVDPWTEEPYEYIPGETSDFRLCAVFETTGSHESGPLFQARWDITPSDPLIWIDPVEGSGHQCFEIRAI